MRTLSLGRKDSSVYLYFQKCGDIIEAQLNYKELNNMNRTIDTNILLPKFIDYCKNNFELKKTGGYEYKSMSVCILECIYSLRAKTESTANVVKRYANAYLNGDVNRSGDTVTNLLTNIQAIGGSEEFKKQILKNEQKCGGKNPIPKEQTCYQLAQYLSYLHIDTMEDFRNYEHQDFLETVIRSVPGIGEAGMQYLFMLTGDENRCKPDVWIHRCIKKACGQDVSDVDCQTLFKEAVAELKMEYPNLTMRGLDSIIWYNDRQK